MIVDPKRCLFEIDAILDSISTNPTALLKAYRNGWPDVCTCYEGPLPYCVPLLAEEGIEFAGGNELFSLMSREMVLRDRLKRLGCDGPYGSTNVLDIGFATLADAIITWGKHIKFQANSPLLKGIRGIFDEKWLVIDAESVKEAIIPGGWVHFEKCLRDRVIVDRYRRDGTNVYVLNEIVNGVVLFPYGDTKATFNLLQFNSLRGVPIERKNIIDYEISDPKQVVKDGKVIDFPWNGYSPEVIVPFVNGIEGFGGIFNYVSCKRDHEFMQIKLNDAKTTVRYGRLYALHFMGPITNMYLASYFSLSDRRSAPLGLRCRT